MTVLNFCLYWSRTNLTSLKVKPFTWTLNGSFELNRFRKNFFKDSQPSIFQFLHLMQYIFLLFTTSLLNSISLWNTDSLGYIVLIQLVDGFDNQFSSNLSEHKILKLLIKLSFPVICKKAANCAKTYRINLEFGSKVNKHMFMFSITKWYCTDLLHDKTKSWLKQ